MIDHNHKFIFVHIPRTGGTSIEEQFGFCTEGIKLECITKGKHHSAKQIFSSAGEDIWSDYFKFTFVRNPWDRVISMYHQPYFNDGKGKFLIHRRPTIGVKSGKGLKFFLDNYKPTYWEHLLCHNYLNYGEMDFIGRFEKRAEHLALISSKLGLDINSTIRSRETNHGHYSEYYNANTIEMVRKMYAIDIERFGYEFEGQE